MEWTLQETTSFSHIEGARKPQGKGIKRWRTAGANDRENPHGKPGTVSPHEMSEGLAPLIVRELMELIKKLRDHITLTLVEQNARFAFSVRPGIYPR